MFVVQGIWTETEVLLLDRNHLGPEQLVRLPQMCNLITMDLSHNNLYQVTERFLSIWIRPCFYLLDVCVYCWPTGLSSSESHSCLLLVWGMSCKCWVNVLFVDVLVAQSKQKREFDIPTLQRQKRDTFLYWERDTEIERERQKDRRTDRQAKKAFWNCNLQSADTETMWRRAGEIQLYLAFQIWVRIHQQLWRSF